MDSKTYWAKREAEQLKHNITEEAEYDRQIRQIYRNMLDGVQTEIDRFYSKYARQEKITLAEAKKRVSKLDIAAYERKAKRYVETKDFSEKANEEMRLYNATMKINRLEMLKANIGLELISGHDELDKFMEEILQGRTMDELERQAGILGKTVRGNAKLSHAIVNGSFHNATFSDRIWQYQDIMKADLSKLLQSGLIQGKSSRQLATELRKYLIGDKYGKGATYNTQRLMRTELCRVQTEAQKQSYQRGDITEFLFICNENPTRKGNDTCPICRGLNGKHFAVEEMMPGTNAPPMHPHCRCSTAPYTAKKREEWEAKVDFVKDGGTLEEWDELKAAGKHLEWKLHRKQDKKQDETKSQFGFRSISGKHEVADDVKTVNPNYRKGRVWQINCQRCVPAYEMRRRGYDVEALPYGSASDRVYNQWTKVFSGAKWDTSVSSNRGKRTMQNIIDKMTEYGDGARAEVYVTWKGASSAHVFAVENVGGKVRFIDPQTGNMNCESYFTQIMPSRTMMCRLDNLEPSELIKDCCKNRE